MSDCERASEFDKARSVVRVSSKSQRMGQTSPRTFAYLTLPSERTERPSKRLTQQFPARSSKVLGFFSLFFFHRACDIRDIPPTARISSLCLFLLSLAWFITFFSGYNPFWVPIFGSWRDPNMQPLPSSPFFSSRKSVESRGEKGDVLGFCDFFLDFLMV
jgi:hypothetical protein